METHPQPAHPHFQNGASGEQSQAAWDAFEDVAYEGQSEAPEDALWCQILLRLLKLFVCLVTLGGLLGGGVVAKLSLLIMTSRIGNTAHVSRCDDSTAQEGDLLPVPEEERIYWTWLILIAFSLPEFLTIFRSLRIWHYKGQELPSMLEIVFPCVSELVYVTGQALFVFCVLPAVDSVQGVILCTSVYLLPTVLGAFSSYGNHGYIVLILNVTSVLLQVALFFTWGFLRTTTGNTRWIFPLAAILTSFGNFYNFIDDNSKWSLLRYLGGFKPNLLKSGYISYAFIATSKILWFFGMMLFCTWLNGVENVFNLFTKIDDAFQFEVSDSARYVEFTKGRLFIFTSPLFLQVIGSTMCYWCGKFACKICIQRFSFALPIVLVVPTSLGLLLLTHQLCLFNTPYFGDLKFVIPAGDFFMEDHYWLWCAWYLSQLWATAHIWNPRVEKLAKTEKLFYGPMYSGLLVDQSGALNRKRESPTGYTRLEPAVALGHDEASSVTSDVDFVQRIYACATMWHETRSEMLELLKSVFKMDEDQGKRRRVLERRGSYRRYYEFETHIFFDDAFQSRDAEAPAKVNAFVTTFLSLMERDATSLGQRRQALGRPLKYGTPYGGRVEWTLPSGTKLHLHLKDKSLIRHKKRWSQCMYMYYILGYMLQDLPLDRRLLRAKNTYLLALDGDVSFQPIAVERLVDFMKRSPKLGAACGRIHPTGEPGPILWYQKFEYAIGHWLQKSTEHSLGCVLCSPGCFSLFRGQALMSPNVLSRYTKTSSEPLHYIQFDQGEDRWLCTLLLQQGYKVDYSAASDAYTHAPEEFDEFFNQRRRWVPSTTANILDLLFDYKRTIGVNSDISFPYILYQSLLMFGTILGPGTIFLVIVGALHRVFHVNMWASFFCNLVPILTYILVCYFCQAKAQLRMAKVLSLVYALVMVTVFVGIALIMVEEGVFAPSSFFLILVALIFIISALMHPLEVSCLVYGLLYCITIPAMYLFLIIFSVFNLNNVSWGTREVETANQQEAGPDSVGGGRHASRIRAHFWSQPSPQDAYFQLSIRGLCNLVCCPRSSPPSSRHLTDVLVESPREEEHLEEVVQETRAAGTEGLGSTQSVAMETATSAPSLSWMEDECEVNGETAFLPPAEGVFWTELIAKYLKPMEGNAAAEAELKKGLLQLRNKVVFNFLMLNAIFVLLVFILELHKEELNIRWPYHHLSLEPIGTLFVAFFGIILLIQFTAMLIHRSGTLAHILASTAFTFRKSAVAHPNEGQDTTNEAMEEPEQTSGDPQEEERGRGIAC